LPPLRACASGAQTGERDRAATLPQENLIEPVTGVTEVTAATR
jgi:hypothetical protein